MTLQLFLWALNRLAVTTCAGACMYATADGDIDRAQLAMLVAIALLLVPQPNAEEKP